MSQATSTILLRGGLNLVTAPLAIPAGQAIAALNYEPDVSGYSRLGGYERFDGQDRPSDSDDPVEIAARRAAIGEVPGTGPVRGVWVYAGHVYAFRDSLTGEGKMYRDSTSGWEAQSFGYVLDFESGVTELLEGENLVGGSSGATARIERVVLRSGAWDGTASGYLVLSAVTGTFIAETVTSDAGEATINIEPALLTLAPGGRYDFTNHNFYGAAKTPRMYGVNGQANGFEWDGEVLAPIRTGTAVGTLDDVTYVVEADGDFVLASDGSYVVLSAEFDRPTRVSHYKGHLFLGYSSGAVIFSALGEPLVYITTLGAGEISFGEELTGLLTAAMTALTIFGRNRIEYVTGDDADTFVMQPITDSSGAVPWSAQMMNSPVYLDDGGIRSLGTTAAFGDWRMGTLSQMVEPLIKAKREAGVMVTASMKVKAKDQYRLFFDDGTGVNVYIGRKQPEILPFALPISVFCACTGEVTTGQGDRLFVGAEDGYVYELDRGLSFDGDEIEAYIRLPFNSIGAPTQNKLFRKATIGIACEDDIEVGVALDVDYARGLGAGQVDFDVEAGSPIVSTEDYGSIDWTQPVQGSLEAYIAGIGKNIALTLITSAADKRAHTLQDAIFNFSPRGLGR